MTRTAGIVALSLALVLALGLGASAMGFGFGAGHCGEGYFGAGAPEDLDAEEREQLRELDQERYETLVPLHDEMRELGFELRQEYLSDAPDQERINELEEQREDLREQMLEQREDYRAGARDFCPRDPETRERGGHHGFGHRGGFGGNGWNGNGS